MSIQKTLVDFLSNSEDFQLLIDDSQALFEQSIWMNYMTDRFTLDLTWQAILGVLDLIPAATVVDYSSGKPLRTRPGLSKLNGELATLGNKYQMSKREQREFFSLQDNAAKLGIAPEELLSFLFPDLKRATLGPHKTVDRLFLQGISTGLMTSTAANNPQGVLWSLNWGITKSNTSTVWSNIAATPLKEIKAIVDAASAKGVMYHIIKMSRKTFNEMTNTTEFKGAYTMHIGVGGSVVEVKNNSFLGINSVNVFMASVDLPMIEIIETSILIEKKDGTTTTDKPFIDGRVSFSVDNNYGQVFRTYSNDSRAPNPIKTYATNMNVLLSRYRDVDGNEFTEGDITMFPVLNKANKIEILITDDTGA